MENILITVLYKLKLEVNMYPFISAFNGKHASSLRAYVYYVGLTQVEKNSKMMKTQLSSPERLGQTDIKKQILDLASV